MAMNISCKWQAGLLERFQKNTRGYVNLGPNYGILECAVGLRERFVAGADAGKSTRLVYSGLYCKGRREIRKSSLLQSRLSNYSHFQARVTG